MNDDEVQGGAAPSADAEGSAIPAPAAVEPDSSRLAGYDLARCLAFLGMVVVNFKVVMGLGGGGSGSREPAWLNDFLGLFTGRAAATFVVLAGVGMTLLYRSGLKRGARSGFGERGCVPVLRYATLGLFLGASVLLCGFHVHLREAGERPPSFARVVSGLFDSDAMAQGISAAWRDYLGSVADGRHLALLVSGWILVAALLVAMVFVRRTAHPRWILARRACFLFALGYAWYPWWTGDILHFYGMYLLAGMLFLGLRWWWAVMGIPALLAGAVMFRMGSEYWDGWTIFLEQGDFWTREGGLRSLLLNGWHPVVPWLAFVLIGVLVGRLDVRRAGPRLLVLGLGIALLLAGELGGDAARDTLRTRAHRDASAVFETEQPLKGAAWWLAGSPAAAADPGTRARMRLREPEDRFPEAFKDAVDDARRYLGPLRRGLPYASLTLALQEREYLGERRVALVIEARYAPGSPAPVQHEQHLEALTHDVALRMKGVRSGSRRRGGGSWPDLLDLVALEHFLPLEAKDPAVSGERVAARVWIDRARLDRVEDDWIRLSRMTGTGSTPPGPFYVISASGSALIVIALCLFLAASRRLAPLLRPLQHTGQMALSLYVLHVLLGLGTFEFLGKLRGENLWFIAFAILVCQVFSVVFAAVWRSLFKRGPAEALMRWMTG